MSTEVKPPNDDEGGDAVRRFGRWLFVLVAALVIGLVLESVTDSAVAGVATVAALLLLVGLMYIGPFLAEAIERRKRRRPR
jgi:hypothetical protein